MLSRSIKPPYVDKSAATVAPVPAEPKKKGRAKKNKGGRPKKRGRGSTHLEEECQQNAEELRTNVRQFKWLPYACPRAEGTLQELQAEVH